MRFLVLLWLALLAAPAQATLIQYAFTGTDDSGIEVRSKFVLDTSIASIFTYNNGAGIGNRYTGGVVSQTFSTANGPYVDMSQFLAKNTTVAIFDRFNGTGLLVFVYGTTPHDMEIYSQIQFFTTIDQNKVDDRATGIGFDGAPEPSPAPDILHTEIYLPEQDDFKTIDGGLVRQSHLTISTVPSAVPEAGNWAMMIAGVGVAGRAMRRRRRHTGIAALAD